MNNSEIIKAEYLDGYRIRVVFDDGVRKIFDFKLLIDNYPVFGPLKDIRLFRSFTLTDTLEWDNGKIDIAPEYLYENGTAA